MQLEQSGYRFSRLILSPMPKSIILISAFVLLLIMFINAILMSYSKPTFTYGDCLLKYYALTHANISSFVEAQAQKLNGGKTPINIKQVYNYMHFVNSSTILQLQTSKQLNQKNQCIIQLDYDTSIEQKIQQNGLQIPKYHTLGFMMSNYPLINMNLTDRHLLAKHNVKVDRIILPPIDSGFRYLGIDVFANNIQDFLYNSIKEFKLFQKTQRADWLKYQQQILNEIKAAAQKQKQKKKEQAKKQIQKQKIQNKTKTQSQSQSSVNASIIEQQGKTPKTYFSLKQSLGENFLESQVINQTITNNQTQQNNKTQPKTNKTNDKLIVLSNLILTSSIKSMLSSHKLIYRLDTSGKMYSMQFSDTTALSHTNSGIIVLISKILYSLVLFSLLIISFHTVGICIRYSYIVVLTLAAILLGSRVYKYVGWLHRFTDIYANPPEDRISQSRKIIIQIGFSFIGMYTLYAVMAKYLTQTMQLIFSSLQFIPSHPNYANQLFKTFFIIQFFHYIFFRTRICISFFPKFSAMSTIAILIMISYHPFLMTTAFLNFYLLFSLFLILCFLFLEKLISQQEFQTGHKPSFERPRMLFYLGFDLDWHKGIPPIWTQFQPWYDLSYASEQQRSYIDKNYQLLYGKLLGVDQPQQLPQDQQQGQQLSNFKRVQMSQNQSSV